MKRASISYKPSAKSVAAMIIPLALVGCQSNSGDVLSVDPASQNAQQQATAPVTQNPMTAPGTVGSGPVRIAYVIAAGTPAASQASEIRNAAELALAGLDDGQLSAEFLPANGTPAAVNERAVEAFVRGASAIVYLGMAPEESAGSALQIYLAPNGSQRPAGAYSFLSSSVDSVEFGLRQAQTAGANSAFLFANQNDSSSSQLNAAIARLKQSGPIQLVTYGSSENPTTVAAKINPPAGAVVGFAGNGQEIGQIASAIKAKAGSIQIIGNSSWQGTGLLSAPSLQGALIATSDMSNEKIVADKYRQKYGSLPSAVAFQVYDTVAIVAGINRAKGKGGLTDGTVKTQSGFKAATGSFRFRADGSVDRLFALKSVKGGNLVQLSPAPSRF